MGIQNTTRPKPVNLIIGATEEHLRRGQVIARHLGLCKSEQRTATDALTLGLHLHGHWLDLTNLHILDISLRLHSWAHVSLK